ncbi:MAG: SbcC/MukB-like Walker B domain-containing protein, partial [Methylococcales bacterium]
DTQNKVQQIEQQQLAIKKQYEIVGTLAKAASGRGNVRVSLERFVLGNILDQVLSIASERLHIMSKGQYRLIRQNEQQQKRNTTAGLDLAIDDAYTGKTRPVATLSGGESFMASLALALGLSDVVQERSGGIQLDTLFIDEGFGSLDQDSLQLAVNTLIDLQSTGRTIGIISHVSELKEQMSQRIEVTGSCTGSTIKVVA